MSNGLDWYKDIENHEPFWIEKAKIKFAVSISNELKSRSKSRTWLAERLKKSSAYVTKLLRGDENLTIATMVRIARAVDCELSISLKSKTVQHLWGATPNQLGVVYGNAAQPKRAVNDGAAPTWEGVAKKAAA